jgi:hypothetical protein
MEIVVGYIYTLKGVGNTLRREPQHEECKAHRDLFEIELAFLA